MEQAVLTFYSKGGLFPHTHSLKIPKSAFAQALDQTFQTSVEYSFFYKHKHSVTLKREDFEKALQGEKVLIRDNETKRHSFLISYTK